MKRALLITWVCATAVSLLNIGTLWPLVVTPLVLVSFSEWRDFLVGPLGVALLAALLTWKARRGAIAANLAFWLAFFAGAEAWRSKMMTQSLPPDVICAEQNSFFQSLMIAGHEYQFMPHAAAVLTDGRVMLWSYAQMAYWEAPRSAYENLDFTACRETVQTALERTE